MNKLYHVVQLDDKYEEATVMSTFETLKEAMSRLMFLRQEAKVKKLDVEYIINTEKL